MKPVIRQGDTLHEYGGEVMEGLYVCYGKPVACQGHAVRCHGRGAQVFPLGGKYCGPAGAFARSLNRPWC